MSGASSGLLRNTRGAGGGAASAAALARYPSGISQISLMLRLQVLSALLWFAIATCGAIPYLVALHTFPIATFYSEFATGLCWIAVAAATLLLTLGNWTGLPKIALAPLGLIAVLFVQLQVSVPLNPYLSLMAVVFLIAATMAIGLGARCRSLPGMLEAFAVGLILGGVLTVGIELMQLFRIDAKLPQEVIGMMPSGTGRRMWANMNQPNHVASYLGFGLAACVFLASKYKRARALLGSTMLAFLLGMSLTVSRITWLHIAVVGILAGLTWTTHMRGSRRWVMMCVPVVGLLVIYQLCNWLVTYVNALYHLDLPTSLAARMQEGVGLRQLLWTHAWHMFVGSPWLGAGWGDYAWNQYVQTDVLGKVEMSMNAHNLVLDLLAKVGLAGAIAVILPFLSLVWSVRTRHLTPAPAFMYAVIFVTVGHSMLEYPLHYLFFLLPFAFALGYVDERILRFPSAGMSWALIAIASICAIAIMVPIWGDYKAVERLHYSPEGFAKELGRYYAYGATPLLLPYENLAMAANWTVRPAIAGSLAKLELQAVQFFPASSVVQRYALSLAYLGKTDDAVVQVRRLHNHYWMDYANQSTIIAQACGQKQDVLKAFCSRLRSENLLASTD
ncbi:Lipid A core - O-antigen ligase and related enzymes [Ralstonia pickettii]|nr:hypothetical protein RP6297_00452 [Ralstonia pickettii]SUE00596.1 Lipid A core - O-antigen ligase and related enzymes [Ralstonia pickettii]